MDGKKFSDPSVASLAEGQEPMFREENNNGQKKKPAPHAGWPFECGAFIGLLLIILGFSVHINTEIKWHNH